MENLRLDYTIPIWGILSIIIVPFLIWLVMSIFSHKSRIKSLETSQEDMNESVSEMKVKLDTYKNDTNKRLDSMNTTMIETKQLVQLLFDNRIKKPGE